VVVYKKRIERDNERVVCWFFVVSSCSALWRRCPVQGSLDLTYVPNRTLSQSGEGGKLDKEGEALADVPLLLV